MESKPTPPESSAITTAATTLCRCLVDLDAAVSLRIHRLAQSIPRFLLLTLEISGDGRFFFPIAISFLLFPLSSSAHVRFIAAALLLGGVVDLLFVGVAKHLIRRPRPVYNKGMGLTFAVDHWSFPSGHSSRVCLIASFIYLSSSTVEASFRDLGKSADSVNLIVSSWAIATSVSRVFLGRHFVFDVFAGACLGVLEGLIVFCFSKAFDSELRQFSSLATLQF